MDFELTQEQRMWQHAVRDFCDAELKPHAAEVDENSQLHWDSIRKMADLGLLSMAVPEDYGGIETDTLSAAIALEEVGRVCGSTALSLAAHHGLGCAPLAHWGTAEQKARWFPKLISGATLGSLALTEPSAGSDLLGVQTSARRDGGDWVIDGSKAWITNAGIAPVITVLLRTGDKGSSHDFSMILVPTDAPGLSIGTPEKKMGVRGSPTYMLSFDHVRVPLDSVLGEQGYGFQQTMQTLDGGRIGIGAISLGLAQAAFEEGVSYATQRRAFGKVIAEHEAIQWMIADAAMEIEAARLMIYRAAWLKDQGKDFTKAAAMGKLMATEVAEKTARNAIQIHGSYGYSREYPVERIYRDQRLMTIGEGTSEIQRIVIARRVLQEAHQ